MSKNTSETTEIPIDRAAAWSPDALTEVLRTGAQRLLAQAVEAEIEAHLAAHKELRDDRGRQRVVRHGHLPEREVQTGIGPIPVRVPRARDRTPEASGGPIQFRSSLLPPYLRRTRSLERLLPWLYLKGVSTGALEEALRALLGPEAPGLSASTISRLKAGWEQDCEQWSGRDMSRKQYVYLWADGVYCQARLEQEKQCLLVLIGADEQGNKELVGLADGYRESEQSWLELLLDLKQRGWQAGPDLVVGDGALGLWKALRKVCPRARAQRCWVHKTRNVLDKLPKGVQARAKRNLQQIWMAETQEEAGRAFQHFVAAYEAKYDKAMECLAKDREDLLAFYDYPAEHWRHLRTTNPIESVFATVRLRTVKTRGCLSRKTTFAMVLQLVLSAQEKWRRLNGPKRLAQVIEGVQFRNGIQEVRRAA